jgi:hypothetical protein
MALILFIRIDVARPGSALQFPAIAPLLGGSVPTTATPESWGHPD